MGGVKDPDPDWFNPANAQLFEQQAKARIEPATARQFLHEYRTAQLPTWVVAVANFKLIEAAAR